MNLPLLIFDLLAFSPEVILFLSSVLALVTGLCFKKSTATYLLLFLAFILAFLTLHLGWLTIAYSHFGNYLRLLLLFCGFLCLMLLSRSSLPYETPILMTISTAALMLLVSSHDFLTLYLTMELSGICFYIMIASRKGSLLGTEATIKYLILAAFLSALYLLGVSFWAGFQGTFYFKAQQSFFDFQPLVQLTGLLIFLVIFFKLGTAPAHLWLADIYQGAPWQVVIVIGTLSKIAFFGLLMRLMTFFSDFFPLSQLLEILGSLSIILGGLAAMRQDDLKRMIAYSSVSNLGLSLLVLSLGNNSASAAALFYFLIYNLLLFLPTFIMVGRLSGPDNKVPLASLALARSQKPVTLLFLNLMILSLAGLPPFAGFFGKLYLLISLIDNKAWLQLSIFLLGAIFSIIYAIKIIQASYFEKSELVIKRGPYPWPSSDILIFICLACINVSLIIFSSDLIHLTLKLVEQLSFDLQLYDFGPLEYKFSRG